MNKKMALAAALTALLAAAGAIAAAQQELQVMAWVDLNRYMGTWYEIAAMPNMPQRGCTDTVVYYEPLKDGGFDVLNTCWKGKKYKPYHGVAKPDGPESKAKFYVKFILFLGSPYWIVDLDPDYKFAAVGVPKRNRLWIISREPTLDEKVYEGILRRVSTLGFDVKKLVKTVHTGKQPPANPKP